MAFEIKVPPFGESITECTVAQWLRTDGETVRQGEDIVLIDSEKASTEIQAEVTGTLRILTPNGTDVAVGAVIGVIEESDAVSETPATAPAAKPVVAPAAPAPAAAPPPPPPPPTPVEKPEEPEPAPPATAGDRGERRVPMTRLRRTIAERLLRARQETAMLTTFAEADMSAVMDMRRRLQETFVQRYGVKLGVMSVFVKAAVEALRAFPEVNASIDGNDIVYHDYYDISVAVSTDRGLVVPVIRDADKKSFADIEREIADLAARARENRLGLDELRGGTFTITNGGVFGSLLSTPLLNPPQVAILGMHAIEDRPVAVDGRVEIRPMMYLALSYDHRLIDGKDAVRFLLAIKQYVGEPERLILGL
ncbi:MAG: dihydrolipoyllysine-residue succinyltransferase [Candidatus Sumerlaeaceae bacterium]|nr:dihydrolipoyllysine-residue succinyltransferase [Candidatus Sumerlaeaceae bacterium]